MSRFCLPGDKVKATLIRFETSNHLKILATRVCGVTERMGVRSHPPKLSDAHGRRCNKNTAINFVQGSNEVEYPFWMYTKKGGIDIVYSLDGFIKISARYSKYLLHLDAEGSPLDCPLSDLIDIILNFPILQVLAEEVTEEEDEESYDDPMNSADRNNVLTVATSNNSQVTDDSTYLSLVSHGAYISCSSSNSLSFYFAVGTPFRCEDTATIWEIHSVNAVMVKATVIHRGTNLTLQDGRSLKEFFQLDKSTRASLVEYNS